MGKRALTNQEFIERSISKHGNKFSYTYTNYKNQKTKIVITCKLHGDFETLPFNHLNGNGSCPKCANIQNGISHKKNTESFIKRAKKVHGDFYNYSFVEYKHSLEKVDIVCPTHGLFKIKPSNQLA